MDEFIPGTIKPESDYEEMARLGAQLGIPVPQMHLGVQVEQADGTVTQHYNGRSRTWVRNFWNYMMASMGGVASTGTTFAAGSLGLKLADNTIANTNYSNGNAGYSLMFLDGTQGANAGIIVGTGTDAESFDHVKLVAQILNGQANNQLAYSGHTPIATYNAATKTWTVATVRQFTNNTTAQILVAETGLLYRNAYNQMLLFCRDKLSSAVSVPLGSVLTVTYTLSLTFPA
jgi:hypothetical protein